MADELEGEEICCEHEIDLKVTEYLDDVVGTNIESLKKAQSLMDSTLKKENELRKRVSNFFNTKFSSANFTIVVHVYVCKIVFHRKRKLWNYLLLIPEGNRKLFAGVNFLRSELSKMSRDSWMFSCPNLHKYMFTLVFPRTS